MLAAGRALAEAGAVVAGVTVAIAVAAAVVLVAVTAGQAPPEASARGSRYLTVCRVLVARHLRTLSAM